MFEIRLNCKHMKEQKQTNNTDKNVENVLDQNHALLFFPELNSADKPDPCISC